MREVSSNQYDEHRYDDLLTYDYSGSRNRKHMPLSERAAQFAPFAALTGFDDRIKETARITDRRMELSEDEIREMNSRLQLLKSIEKQHPSVTIAYFCEDEQKEGGRYLVHSGNVRRIDEMHNLLCFEDRRVRFEDILEIHSEIFSEQTE